MKKRKRMMRKIYRELIARHPHLFQMLLCIGILVISITVTYLLIASKKAPEKLEKSLASTLVDVIKVKKGEHSIVLTAYGTVEAEQDVDLRPEVGGKIIEQSPALRIGGLFRKDDLLVRIDPRDFEASLAQAKASVAKAQLELMQEQGRKLIAEKEWELLDSSIKGSDLGYALALREPQIADKKAALEAAKSLLVKAEADVERTQVRAPFAALVISESVELGQLVSPLTSIARLAGTESFRIVVSLPYQQLAWIRLNAKAVVQQELASGASVIKEGVVSRILGDLSSEGRMARVVLLIQNPLGIVDLSPPLLLSSYVRTKIQGPTLKDIVTAPRTALRGESSIWVKKEDNSLEIREVEIIFKDEQNIFISKGLEDGESLIISSLSSPIQGMKLREISDTDEEKKESQQ
jgi:RND family efflux transporter MFP subunit